MVSAPLSADVLAQIRTAGLTLPRPPYPGQGWTPLTGPEQHLLREGYRLDRVRQLLLAEIGRLRRIYADRAVQRSAGAAGPLEHAELCPLTHGERTALAAAAAGESPADTSRRLLIPYDTVRSQRKRAVSRLGARTVIHAVAIAVAAGWITGEQITGGVTP